jgi:hypothetical protein
MGFAYSSTGVVEKILILDIVLGLWAWFNDRLMPLKPKT